MRGLSASEQAVIEQAAAEPMLDHVQAWAAVNSGSRNLGGLATTAEIFAAAFSCLPGEIALAAPSPVEAMSADGALLSIAHGANLHLVVRPEAPVQVLLTGHMDTVFGADHPFQDVFWREPDRVLGGPGVADMKGGIALMLAALKAVEDSPAAARLGYEVVINSDEEVGSPGSAALIARAARGKKAALTYEPAALPDGTLAGARPGSGNFSIHVEGRSAHAGRNPEEGRNALVAAADLALRLDRAKGAGLKVNPAKIDGGGPNNVVPDHAVLRVNLRPATPDDEALARTPARRGGRRRRRRARRAYPSSRRLRPAAQAARRPRRRNCSRSCVAAGADLGQEISWRATGGVCDGNNIAACGVPVVDTMGVRGGAIHSADEYLIVESLAERAALSALTLLRLADGEDL